MLIEHFFLIPDQDLGGGDEDGADKETDDGIREYNVVENKIDQLHFLAGGICSLVIIVRIFFQGKNHLLAYTDSNDNYDAVDENQNAMLVYFLEKNTDENRNEEHDVNAQKIDVPHPVRWIDMVTRQEDEQQESVDAHHDH